MSKPQQNSPDKNNGSPVVVLNRKHRHSLQPESIVDVPPSSLRHTQSHRYDSGGRKKSKKATTLSDIPAITEAENSEDESEENSKTFVQFENEKATRGSKSSKKNNNDIKLSYVYENSAFEGNTNTSRNSTVTVRTNSSRAPSIQSLEVLREQYCCCAKRTKCERTLLITVTVLTIIIIVLIIVIGFLANRDDLRDLKINMRL